MEPRSLIIIGSLNVDYLAEVDQLPLPGQTVSAARWQLRFGGKGANQAVAAARQGAQVKLIGCVGDDPEGETYLNRLRKEGIDVRGLGRAKQMPSGRAFISVDKRGENTIVVAPGANHLLQARDLSSVSWKAAGLVLAQLESPVPAVAAAFRASQRAGVPVMLNAAPFRPEFPWGEVPLDYLVVNELEAAELFGGLPRTARMFWAKTKKRRERLGVSKLIVTRGRKSTWCILPEAGLEVATVPVRPVDTVGAGDAFSGTLAAHLARGRPFLRAVELANCAGALATRAVGAQESLPTWQETQRLARTHFSYSSRRDASH